MISFMHLLRSYCSCCLNCGSFFIKDGLLCEPCQGPLQRLRAKPTPKPKGYPVRTLYEWRPGQSDLLSNMVLSLKGTKHERVWSFYAKKFAQSISETLPLNKKIYVIPAPPRKKGHQDHAYLWAKGLAEILGAELLPCLEKQGKLTAGKQRRKDRGERSLLELKANVNYTDGVDFSASPFFVFADDIVTTGATARAAHIALGSPPHFEVWALAKRSLSCGASSDLL